MATTARAKSVSIAPSMLFNIEEDQDSIPIESSPSAISHTLRTLSSPPRKASKALSTSSSSSRPGAVSNATTVQSNDDYNDSRGAFLRQRRRARSRKPSIYATWTFCGLGLSNAALRLITSAVTIPAIVVGLVLTPRLALASFCATLVCVGAYEFAWLAFRIHHQLLTTYNYYERKATSSSSDNAQPDGAFPFQSFVSETTQTTMSFSTGNFSFYTQNERDSFEEPVRLADADANGGACAPTGTSPSCDAPLDERSADLLVSIAASCFGGRVVVARVALAVPIAALWSLAMHYLYASTRFPVAAVPQAFVDFPYFFWAVNALAAVCALAAPTVPAALSLALQKELFIVLLLNSANCPLSSGACEAARPTLSPLQTLMLGVLLLLLLRSAVATNPADLVIAFTLDALGFVYVVGTLAVLAAVVDTSDAAGSVFVNVLLLLLSVVWTAELAGYVCDAVMYHFRIHHAQLFPQWLALKFDVEAAICSVGIGIAAMLIGCELLRVPGVLHAKVACALLAVLSGRLGRLFLSLMKKAAGVRWSSCLLPGYGGVLDAVSMLLFASLVFAQYFVYVGTLVDAAVRRQEDAAQPHGTTVNFATQFAGL